MGRPKNTNYHALTEVELTVMQQLWDFNRGVTVSEVLNELNASLGIEYAYTTVSTILRVLEKKKFVSSEKVGRGHEYFANVAKGDYQIKVTGHLVEKIYKGEVGQLVKNLIDQGELTSKDLQEVSQLLDQVGKKC